MRCTRSFFSVPLKFSAQALVRFATKPHLAADMITDAVQTGTPARWVAGDEVPNEL